MVTAEKAAFKKAFNKAAFSIDEDGDGGLPRSPQKSKTSGLHPPKQWHLMISTTEKWDNTSNDGMPIHQWQIQNKKGCHWKENFVVNKNSLGEKSLLKLQQDKDGNSEPPKLVAHQMMVFDILHAVHSQGHKGASNLHLQIQDSHCNITFDLCKTFCEMCPVCNQAPGRKKNSKVPKNPLVLSDSVTGCRLI